MKLFPGQSPGSSRWKVAVLAAVVTAALGGAAFAGYTALSQAGAETARYRWGNVTVEAPAPRGPDDIRVVRESYTPGMYSPDFSPEPSMTAVPAIRLSKGQGFDASWVVIDASTAELLYEQIQPEDRAAFEAILATVRVEGDDMAGAPWPYGAAPPQGARVQWGNITYVEPDAASGIVVRPEMGDIPGRGGVRFLRISTARSFRGVNAETGEIVKDLVDERDREAFDRFTSSIELVTS